MSNTWHNRRRLKIVQNFFAQAEEMRAYFDRQFQSPMAMHGKRFTWDYWHVPHEFTYLRTPAKDFFPPKLFHAFQQRLREWGKENLGSEIIREPWLSYYVNGCRQELHTDAPHGPWAFVYSLTRWRERRFKGGETLLLSPSCLSIPSQLAAGRAGPKGKLVERIPTLFNQLTVFDPRIPHGVATVEGTLDSMESRIVIHSWFAEPILSSKGGLSTAQCAIVYENLCEEIGQTNDQCQDLSGVIVFRVHVEANGDVKDVRIVNDTLLTQWDDDEGPLSAAAKLQRRIQAQSFPAAKSSSSVLLPLAFPRAHLCRHQE